MPVSLKQDPLLGSGVQGHQNKWHPQKMDSKFEDVP